jgi:hypothetical protein
VPIANRAVARFGLWCVENAHFECMIMMPMNNVLYGSSLQRFGIFFKICIAAAICFSSRGVLLGFKNQLLLDRILHQRNLLGCTTLRQWYTFYPLLSCTDVTMGLEEHLLVDSDYKKLHSIFFYCTTQEAYEVNPLDEFQARCSSKRADRNFSFGCIWLPSQQFISPTHS